MNKTSRQVGNKHSNTVICIHSMGYKAISISQYQSFKADKLSWKQHSYKHKRICSCHTVLKLALKPRTCLYNILSTFVYCLQNIWVQEFIFPYGNLQSYNYGICFKKPQSRTREHSYTWCSERLCRENQCCIIFHWESETKVVTIFYRKFSD